ncbi:hypothetical protein BD769DRAFT_1503577 [Suillus cothurnatus]|nr:hypothetical protein BD769DRAFT_1503577 [Suillus cothurnatus]
MGVTNSLNHRLGCTRSSSCLGLNTNVWTQLHVSIGHIAVDTGTLDLAGKLRRKVSLVSFGVMISQIHLRLLIVLAHLRGPERRRQGFSQKNKTRPNREDAEAKCVPPKTTLMCAYLAFLPGLDVPSFMACLGLLLLNLHKV